MPLFNAVIEVRVVYAVAIPVSAPSEEAAWEYVTGTDEWEQVLNIHDQDPLSQTIMPTSVQRITHPSQADYSGDTDCWGPEYYDENNEPYGTGYGDTAGVVFYGIPSEGEETDEASQRQYDEFRRLEDLFDKERMMEPNP